MKRREFITRTIQGILSALSIGYLLRNERIDRLQDKRLLQLKAYNIADLAISTDWRMRAGTNDQTLLAMIQETRRELGLKPFVIRRVEDEDL